jgi:hypothetical protein
MDTDRDDRPDRTHDEGALAGGDFTDELTEGQLDADAESGSTAGTEDRATTSPAQQDSHE